MGPSAWITQNAPSLSSMIGHTPLMGFEEVLQNQPLGVGEGEPKV